MPSPFGHSLAGCIVAIFMSRTHLTNNLRTIFLYVFVANAADLDFIPGILMGKPSIYHHGISHSLGMAVIVSLTLAIMMNLRGLRHFNREFILYLSLYGSHLLLDYMTFDGGPIVGIPLFWPLSEQYYIAPYTILPPVMHAKPDANLNQFIQGVFSSHNLRVILLEILIMLPLMAILVTVSQRKEKMRAGERYKMVEYEPQQNAGKTGNRRESGSQLA